MSDLRIAILIDGIRVHTMANAAGVKVDYSKVLEWAGEQGRVVSAKFFTQTPPEGEHNVFRLIDFLEYHGWEVIERTASMIPRSDGSGERMSGNMDTYLVTEACKIAHSNKVDRVYILGGSHDITPALTVLRENMVEVVIVGTENGVSKHLTRQVGGNFVDLKSAPFSEQS